MTGTARTTWASGISAITLFTEDLDGTKAFYREVFGLEVVYEDAESAVFDFGTTLVNLLRAVPLATWWTPRRSRPLTQGRGCS